MHLTKRPGFPKNSRYSTSKAEFNIEGYDLFPEKFPIQDTRGILVYIKQDLKAVEVNIDQDFKECVLVKVNPGRFAPKSESIHPT